MRGIRWTCTFMTPLNKTGVINIYEEDYSGSTTTVVGAPDPFYCEEENSEDLLDAIRFQTGYISLVERTHGELDDLYPLNDFQHYVTVTYGGSTIFTGYMQAQAWSNEFAPAPRVLQFPVISPLGLLSAKKFTAPVVTSTPYSISFVTLSSLLSEVVNGLNAGYHTFDMPTITKRTSQSTRTVGLSDVVSTLAMCPFNDNFNCMGTESLFKPKTYEDFMKGLCAAFGVMVHDTPGELVFTRPESASGTSYTLTNVFQFADAEGTEGLVMPVKEVTLKADGEDLDNVELDFKHTVINNVLTVSDSAYTHNYVLFKPKTDEWWSTSLETNANECSQLSDPATFTASDFVFLTSFQRNDEKAHSDRCMFLHGDVIGHIRFHVHTANYGFIRIHAKWGYLNENYSSPDGQELTAVVTCKGFYTDGDIWTGSHVERTVKSYGGTFEFGVPANWLTESVDIAIQNPFAEDGNQAFFITGAEYKELDNSPTEIFPWWDVRTNTEVVITGNDDNADSASLDMSMSYAVANGNMITNSTGSDYYAAHTTNYAYMFRSQRRIECTVKKKVAVSDIYNNTYTYNGETYRVIAVAYYPWDDNYKLTLQTVYTS